MIVAVDIGGTKTLAALFDEHGKVIAEKRILTNKNIQLFLQDLRTLLKEVAPNPAQAISIAAPGQINTKEGAIVYSPNLKWHNVALVHELMKEYSCPIYLQNDANIAGLGATRTMRTVPPLVLYVTIGTGIGTGVIINGHVNPALEHGEGGHMVFATQHGLREWEAFASGRAIYQRFGRLASDITNPADWQRVADALLVGFRVLIPILQPNLILIGGGVGTYFEHFQLPLQKMLRQEIPQFIPIPPIQKVAQPEKAVIYGCYYHALDSLQHNRTTPTRP